MVFAPTALLCPGLQKLLEVRRVVGLRNPAHSLVKLMNPSAGTSLIISSYTHPEYALSMAATFALTGANALLLRGTEGEAVADPRRAPRMELFLQGQSQLLQEAQSGSLEALPDTAAGHRSSQHRRLYPRGVVRGQPGAGSDRDPGGTYRAGRETFAAGENPMNPGTVTLVGAGPGDPDLLTLKAARAISQATVLLVDDLVSDAIVAMASPSARVIHVGKRGGCKSTPQAFIEKLMLSAARDGETVVRLKGGDPFIFGRGGEEVEHLRAAGIAVNVVNGITAGVAAATSIGVPLTHRDHAQGVVFITGHARRDGVATDWRALAATARDARLTLVIYMGVAGAQRLQDELLHGLAADTPVALIQNASLPTQRQVVTELGHLVQTISREQIGSPAIIVVGEVARTAMLAADLAGSATQALPMAIAGRA